MKLSWQKKLEGLFPWVLSWPISFSSQAPLCFLSQAKVPFIHFFLFLSHEALYWWQCWSSPTFYILSGTLLSNRIFILFFGCKRRNHFVLSSPTIKTNEDEVRLLRRSRRREGTVFCLLTHFNSMMRIRAMLKPGSYEMTFYIGHRRIESLIKHLRKSGGSSSTRYLIWTD